jgi:hypothetical protein
LFYAGRTPEVMAQATIYAVRMTARAANHPRG